MIRKFSRFTLKSDFPEEEIVTINNYYKYNWTICNNEGEFVTGLSANYIYPSDIKALVSGDEQAVKDTFKIILARLLNQANNLIHLL